MRGIRGGFGLPAAVAAAGAAGLIYLLAERWAGAPVGRPVPGAAEPLRPPVAGEVRGPSVPEMMRRPEFGASPDDVLTPVW